MKNTGAELSTIRYSLQPWSKGMQGTLQVYTVWPAKETAVTLSGGVCRSRAGCWQHFEGGQMLSVLGQRSGSGWVHEVNFWPHMRQMAFLWTLSCQTSFLFQNQRMGSLVFKLLHFYYKLSILTAAAEWREDEEWELVGPLPLRVGHLPLGWQNHVKGCCTKPWMCHLGRTVQLTRMFQHLMTSAPLSLSLWDSPSRLLPSHVPLTQLPPTVPSAIPDRPALPKEL